MSRWAPSLNGFLLDFAKLSVVRGVVVAGDGVESGAECCVEDAHAEGMVIAMQKRKWSSGRRWTGIGVVGVALALASVAPALADEVEAVSIPLPAEEPEAEQAKPEVTDSSSWEAQRRIPAMSPFVNGTGYWGPSNKPGYD